jgi:arylsulfatase B
VVGEAGGGAEPLNVLIITVDDVGVDKVDGYVHDAYADYETDATAVPRMPALDLLAASGARFTDAWANPSCSPTRAAMVTGNMGYRTGIGRALSPFATTGLDPELSTLGDLASSVGYTSAVFGKWHLGHGVEPEEWEEGDGWDDHLRESYAIEAAPVEVGFDAFYGNLHGELNTNGSTGYYDWVRMIGRVSADAPTTTSTRSTIWAPDQNVTDAVTWIERQSTPWVAVVNFNTPHLPLENPPAGCHRDEDPEWTALNDLELFQAMLECTDVAIESLLGQITDLDDTVILVIGDNGTLTTLAEGKFDDGRGKGTVYESGVRVPFVVADGRTWLANQEGFVTSTDWRRSTTVVGTAGVEVADPVHVVDFYATVAEIIGADGSAGLDSVSMVPLLSGGEGAVRDDIYVEHFEDTGVGDAALRVGEHKLVLSVINDGGTLCRTDYELYDLLDDRFEDVPLNETQPELLAEMRTKLDARVAGNGIAWLDVPDC